MDITKNFFKPKLVIISGVSGSGKTYILNKMINNEPNYKVIKKRTTRSPRKSENLKTNIEFKFNCTRNEVENCDYYYSFKDELYGFNFCDIESYISKSHDVIMIIKPIQIVKAVKRRYDNCITILCKPLLDKRDIKDFIRNETDDEIDSRLYNSDDEYINKEYAESMNFFDYIALNDYSDFFTERIINFLKDYPYEIL